MPQMTIDQLTETLIAAAPNLGTSQRKIARAVYHYLALGEPVRDEALAEATGLSSNEVRSTLDALNGVYRDESDGIIGFWGLSLVEMPHRIEVNDVNLYAWCAWDTLFLPDTLAAVAHVESHDPASGETIALTVTPEGVNERSHPGIAVSFLIPNGPFDADVIASFCHYVHFFTSTENAARWMNPHDDVMAVSLDEAFEIGRQWNAALRL